MREWELNRDRLVFAEEEEDGTSMFRTVWHNACEEGNTAMCAWIQARHGLHLINSRDRPAGWTALMDALYAGQSSTARWMLDNGADPNVISADGQDDAFSLACKTMTIDFVQELAAKVPRRFLTGSRQTTGGRSASPTCMFSDCIHLGPRTHVPTHPPLQFTTCPPLPWRPLATTLPRFT